MKKRWILNLIMLAVVAGLVSFLYLKPKQEAAKGNSYEVSSYKLAEFNAIKVEFPAKAAVPIVLKLEFNVSEVIVLK